MWPSKQSNFSLAINTPVGDTIHGWVFFVSAGGPNPSNDGHIYMEK
jgi:hypothetical protein